MAGYLLDSHTLLWLKAKPGEIRDEALAEIANPLNAVFVSVAAIWELAIKSAKGKLGDYVQFGVDDADALLRALQESGIGLLAIQMPHTLTAAWLPPLHSDPFDRMMIAQAQREDLAVATRDPVFSRYQVRVLAV